jgi:ATP/ADP translocase
MCVCVRACLFTSQLDLAQFKGLEYLVSLIKNWDYSLFYVMSELFGSVGVSVLFWQLANEIIKVDEAKVRHKTLGGPVPRRKSRQSHAQAAL